MIENMRKYTGLMAVVFVLLGAGFLFTMNNIGGSRGGGGSGPTMLEVYGNSYDQSSYQRMGMTTLQLASDVGLHSYINFLMAPNAPRLQQALQMGRYGMNYFSISQRSLSKQDLNRFIINRVILQKAMKDMGLFANEEEIVKAIKTSRIFSSEPGKFDKSKYTEFVENQLGKRGMTEKDLHSIIRESLCLNKLVTIIGGGLSPTHSATQDMLEAQNQTITLAKIVFNRDDFVEKEKPTEEEIKAYWESHQDAYKTDEKRSISYVLLNLPEEKKEEKKDDAKLTEEEKKAKAKADAEKAEKHHIAAIGLAKEIKAAHQQILDAESNKQPLDFNEIMEARKHKVVDTELFAMSDLPAEIKDFNLRGSFNRNKPLSQAIFEKLLSKNDYDHVSDPLPVGESAWIVFVLRKVETPVLLKYADARNKARASLVSENGTKKTKQAAKDQRAAILALMKSGKDFDSAAKEKGLTPVQVGPFTTSDTPKDEPSAATLHNMATKLNPGDVSESIDEADRSLFFYVDKREIEDTKDNQLQVDQAVNAGKMDLMIRTYLNWINHQYALAEVKGQAVEQ